MYKDDFYMIPNTKLLGLTAFITYFGMDALTICLAVLISGAGAESNPLMVITLGSYGLLGFIALKLLLSIGLIVPSYILSILPGTRITGTSALVAILTGGILVTLNNATTLVMGVSIFYGLFHSIPYLNPVEIFGFIMLITSVITFAIMSLSEGHVHYLKSQKALAKALLLLHQL